MPNVGKALATQQASQNSSRVGGSERFLNLEVGLHLHDELSSPCGAGQVRLYKTMRVKESVRESAAALQAGSANSGGLGSQGSVGNPSKLTLSSNSPSSQSCSVTRELHETWMILGAAATLPRPKPKPNLNHTHHPALHRASCVHTAVVCSRKKSCSRACPSSLVPGKQLCKHQELAFSSQCLYAFRARAARGMASPLHHADGVHTWHVAHAIRASIT